MIINGTDENDILVGTFGSDYINGLDGDDIIFGGGGADFIHGAMGNDTMWGGGGADIFDFGLGFPGKDVIRDFQQGLDHISLRVEGEYEISYDFGTGNSMITFAEGSIKVIGVQVNEGDIV